MSTLPSVVTPEVVILTTSGATHQWQQIWRYDKSQVSVGSNKCTLLKKALNQNIC